MKKNFILIALLIGVIALPFLVRKKSTEAESYDETLIILTPHNEALRFEFQTGFQDWYFRKTGKRVKIDWRVPGSGSQDAVRFVDSMYTNGFRVYWENTLDREWTRDIENAFVMRASHADYEPGHPIRDVYEVFKTSDVSCGMDIFFGGGDVDLMTQAKKGQVIPLQVLERHPEWFSDEQIPETFQGNVLREKKNRWVGTAISGFGIIYNKDVLEDIGFEGEVNDWIDLANPKLYGEVALSDPSISGVFTRAFEVIFQLYMQEEFYRLKVEGEDNKIRKLKEQESIAKGWERGLSLIQLISANARYFTDSSTKPVLDVAAGDCGVGMNIDFYGLFQVENLKIRGGKNRFKFIIPKSGTAVSPDPIAIFRGAPHPELAESFIEFMLSLDGQKLWDFRVGTPGGPQRYAISRSPIHKKLYTDEFSEFRSNPELNYYTAAEGLIYRPNWTAPLFKQMRFIIKVIFIDVHGELREAWKAIIDARNEGRHEDADKAQAKMGDLHLVRYEKVMGSIKDILNKGTPLERIKLQAKLTRHFQNQYAEAAKIARGNSHED